MRVGKRETSGDSGTLRCLVPTALLSVMKALLVAFQAMRATFFFLNLSQFARFVLLTITKILNNPLIQLDHCASLYSVTVSHVHLALQIRGLKPFG